MRDLNSGPSEEPSVLLPAETSHQPQSVSYNCMTKHLNRQTEQKASCRALTSGHSSVFDLELNQSFRYPGVHCQQERLAGLFPPRSGNKEARAKITKQFWYFPCSTPYSSSSLPHHHSMGQGKDALVFANWRRPTDYISLQYDYRCM